MHAVVTRVTVDGSREAEARSVLQDVVVPQAMALPGFEGGHWLRALDDSTEGTGMLFFDTEANARAAADQIRSEGPPPQAPVTMEAVTEYEVVVQA